MKTREDKLKFKQLDNFFIVYVTVWPFSHTKFVMIRKRIQTKSNSLHASFDWKNIDSKIIKEKLLREF